MPAREALLHGWNRQAELEKHALPNQLMNYFTSSLNTAAFSLVENIGAETPPVTPPVVHVKVVAPAPAVSVGAAAVPPTVVPVQVMVLPVIAEIVSTWLAGTTNLISVAAAGSVRLPIVTPVAPTKVIVLPAPVAPLNKDASTTGRALAVPDVGKVIM
jgi:hypothetical protein